MGNFETSNIKEMDEVFNHSNYLKFINLRPYNGKDIFNSIVKENITICVDESKTNESEYQTLKDLNAVNNCTDYCFYEFNIINKNKTGCDLDCPNITDESETHHYICYPKINSTIPLTETIKTIPLPPLKLLLYGYDKFRIVTDRIYFSIHFRSITYEDSYPSELTFSIIIYYGLKKVEYKSDNSPDTINKTATCQLIQNGQLLAYDCQVKLDTSNITINNVAANLDLNFNRDYTLYLSPQANYTRVKLQNQAEEFIIPEYLLVLIGNISLENEYFSVKGNLTGDSEPDDDFTLTIFDKITGNPYNISCVTQNKSKDNFEIKCNKDQQITANLNNTLGNMDETKLLLILNDGNDDLYKVDITNSTSSSAFKYISKKNNQKLSAGAIVAIVLSIVLVLILLALLLFMIKKKLNKNVIVNGDDKESKVNSNVYIMN